MLIILVLAFLATLGWIFLKLSEDRLRRYRDVLGLQKANLVYADNYQKVRNLVLPTRETAFSEAEPIIWIYKNNDTELFLGANEKSDVRLWLEVKTVLDGVHVVLDSTFNNSMRTNLKRDKLPKQQIDLEGNFPDHFKLYCNPGQQVIALQIIAPDVMAYLLDSLISADVEIVDNQIAIIVKGGAKTLERLKASIELAERIDKLASAATKVTKL